MAAGGNIMESIPTEFDYFESTVIQAAIINEYDHPFGPIGTFQPGTPIEIVIPPTSNCYRDLNNSKLEVTCKITNADGSNIANDAPVGPVNLLLHSMFQNIEVDLGNKRISDPNNFMPYRAYLETMLTYNKDVGETRLLSEGWQPDTSTALNDFRRVADGANLGFKRRATRFHQSRIETLIGRPHLDLFHQDKDIPPGVRIMLRFIPAPNAFVIKKPAGTAEDYRLKIMSIKLWVRTKEVSPSLLLSHQAMLQQNNIRLPYTKVTMKHMTIPTGVTSMEFDNIFTGQQPNRFLLAFLRDETMNAGSNTNPFQFEHVDINYLVWRVNGEQFPRVPFQPDFEHEVYLREYLALLEALNLDTGNKAINLSPSNWANTFPVFMFRTTPSGLPSIPRTGASRLELRFRLATPHIYNILCYAEFPALLEIDQFNNVLG